MAREDIERDSDADISPLEGPTVSV